MPLRAFGTSNIDREPNISSDSARKYKSLSCILSLPWSCLAVVIIVIFIVVMPLIVVVVVAAVVVIAVATSEICEQARRRNVRG